MTVEASNGFPQDVFTKEQRSNGAIVFHIIGFLYMTYAITLVCDKFFVPSIDEMGRKLRLRSDVAGATLMAFGSSMPDLVASVVGAMDSKSQGTMGSIAGSAVFNLLFVIAISSLAIKEQVRVNKWPTLRDSLFYSISLIALFVFFQDERIFWYESLSLFLLYIVYIIFIKFNDSIKNKLNRCSNGVDGMSSPAIEEEEGEDNAPLSLRFPTESIKRMLCYIISMPAMILLCLTLPDVKNKDFTIIPSFKIPGQKLFMWTFLGSTGWICGLSYLLVWWATVIQETLGIPPEIFGLVIIATVTSLPSLVCSILVVRQCKGDMAVSSSIGSNLFDITVGMPIPWLMRCVILGESYANVSSVGGTCTMLFVFLSLILFLLSLVGFKWRLKRMFGVILLIIYVIFVLIALSFTYEFIACPV